MAKKLRKKAAAEKYERWQFKLEECETLINIIENQDDPGYAVAFLNLTLPDGRWIVFKAAEAYRIPLFKPGKETPK